jgi:hypothetical protein
MNETGGGNGWVRREAHYSPNGLVIKAFMPSRKMKAVSADPLCLQSAQ